MTPMTLSLRLSSDMTARQLLQGAAGSRDAGFGRVWLADNPLERSSPITAAAIAAAQPGLEIGLGIVSARERHPVVLAQEVLALQSFSQGRIHLGLGVGVDAHRRQLGLPAQSGLELLRDTTDVFRTLTTGGTVPSFGDGGNPVTLKIPGTPIPVYVGAVGPRTLALAGEIADGVVLSLGTTSDAARTGIALSRKHFSPRAGVPSFDGVCYVAFGGVGEGSVERLAVFAAHFLGVIVANPALATLLEGTGLDLAGAAAAVESYRAGVGLPSGVAESMGIAGSLDTCVERLADYRAAGVDEVALGMGTWNASLGATLDDVARLAAAWTAAGAA